MVEKIQLWLLSPPRASRFRRHELAAASFEREWFADAAARAAAAAAARGEGEGASEGESEGEGEARGSFYYYCVQRPDETLFVPQGWAHATINLRESIGVAGFFLDDDAAGYRPNKAWHTAPGIRSLQTAAGISAPSDYDANGHP